jgi:hypothetical protein
MNKKQINKQETYMPTHTYIEGPSTCNNTAIPCNTWKGAGNLEVCWASKYKLILAKIYTVKDQNKL